MTKAAHTLDREALSRPENAVFRLQARPVVEQVIARGGCWYCTRRDARSEGWGRAVCGKVQPATFMQAGCAFEPDHERLAELQGSKPA